MFLYSHWLNLPLTTRIKIANQFNIIKRGSTEVVENQVKSDGYNVKEIEEALNIDALQKYIGTQEIDMIKLWTWFVDKVEGRELSGVNIDTTVQATPQFTPTEVKKKSGRPKKNVQQTK